MRTEKAATTYAETLGMVAYAKGICCAPAMDQNIRDLMADRQAGDSRTMAEMKAWLRGWHKANLAASV